MLDLQQLDRRSNAATVSLWCVALSDLIAIPTGFSYLDYLESLDPTAVVADIEPVASELAYGMAGLAQTAALIFAVILFIRWFHLCHANLVRLFAETPSRDSRWAIWGFFVPILNFIRPQQVMREIWSYAGLRWSRADSRTVGLTVPRDIVNLWWGLFVASNLASNIVGRAYWRAESAQETLWAASAMLFVDGFDVIAALAAVAIVRNTTQLLRPFWNSFVSAPAA